MRSDSTTRREFMVMGGAAALTGMMYASLPVVRTFAAGDADITVISDGNLILPLNFSYPDIPVEELVDYIGVDGAVPASLEPDCNVTLMRSGDRLVLFDTGSGSNFMPTAGKLFENLAEAGIDPSEVTDVVFTHAHPDHLWGLIDDFDEPAFPEAAFHMGRAEWDYWTDPATVDSIGEARRTFAVGAASRLERIADTVKLFDPGVEVVPQVEAVATFGHTPGHTSFMIHGGSEPVLVVGDALLHARISFERPHWPTGSDQDAQMAIATRATLLDRLVAENARLIGYHLPHPGEGRVEKSGAYYRYVAV